MNPSNPWLRFFAAIVGAAIAIRLAADLIRPVIGFVIAALAITGLVLLIRWWRSTRW